MFLFCRNTYNDACHWAHLESKWFELISAINRVGHYTFEVERKEKIIIIPGWNNHVKILYQYAREACNGGVKVKKCTEKTLSADRLQIRLTSAAATKRRCRTDRCDVDKRHGTLGCSDVVCQDPAAAQQ